MAKPTIELVSESRCFDGRQLTYKHLSTACDCTMRFAVFLPPAQRGPVPALYWLSGLTCTEENFSIKSGAQRYAAELGLALIIPDTSPRGVNIPGEDAQMDVGTGAGFYLNATAAPWAAHYRMYDYIRDELVAVVNANLPIDPARKSISGHSMGGHGALIIGVGNPEHYRSVSAFSPIAAASQSAWGQRALTAYIGADRERWLTYDAAAVIRAKPSQHELLVTRGCQIRILSPAAGRLKAACRRRTLTFRERPGYDHGYYFVSTFIGEHLRFHAGALR
jgi:S-formylglutathione hydrolase